MEHFCHAKRKGFVSCKSPLSPRAQPGKICSFASSPRVCPGVINLLCFVICQYAVSRVIDLGLYSSLHKRGLRLGGWRFPLSIISHEFMVHGNSWKQFALG